VNVLLITVIALASDHGYLEVTVREADNPDPMPCRAWIQSGTSQYYYPETAAIVYDKDESFACDGRFRILVPAGDATIHIERGKEFVPINQLIMVHADTVTRKELVLRRWVSMSSEGWFSSDLHMHFSKDNIENLKRLALSDDINLLPTFTYWYHRLDSIQTEWPFGESGEFIRVDSLHFVTRNNVEIERIGGEPFNSIGAPFFFNLIK